MRIRDLKICVVDDDPIFVFTLKTMFEIKGIVNEFDHFENGEDAYLEISKNLLSNTKYYDLIILDINMPIWDGWDFLNEIEKLNLREYPAIYLSSSSTNPEDIKSVSKYKVLKGFISKPLTIEKLSKELNLEI